MTHLIAMLDQAGTLVLAEGVETDDELTILMHRSWHPISRGP
jgi:EAL domain-containing protein (putative c-di-GMP-specific phosphodiesterase class I)